jgi:hypothetical protein
MDTFDDVTLDLFAQLDDFDIISALKAGNARVILFYPAK